MNKVSKSPFDKSIVDSMGLAVTAGCQPCFIALSDVLARTFVPYQERLLVLESMAPMAISLQVASDPTVIKGAASLVRAENRPTMLARKLELDVEIVNSMTFEIELNAFHLSARDTLGRVTDAKAFFAIADLIGKTEIPKRVIKRPILDAMKKGATNLGLMGDDRVITDAVALTEDPHLVAEIFGAPIDHVRVIYDGLTAQQSRVPAIETVNVPAAVAAAARDDAARSDGRRRSA